MPDFSGKKVLVTGASRGIGRGIALAFAQAGADVAITYQSNEAAAQEVLKLLNDSAKNVGKNHKAFQLDGRNPESIEKVFEKILAEWQSLDVLINNAGITKDQLLLRLKSDDWDQVLETNLRGVFLCTKLAVKMMLKARSGAVVNVTSVIGQTGNPGQASYAASKAGIIAFTKSVALEVASRGIRLNCIAPGFIQSDMTESLSAEQRQSILQKVPLGSMGEASDVAQGCLFLASSNARYITGHTLNVNGGLFMS
jgi:3-oxoacyl-[acyl-carrier protein] reductase